MNIYRVSIKSCDFWFPLTQWHVSREYCEKYIANYENKCEMRIDEDNLIIKIFPSQYM